MNMLLVPACSLLQVPSFSTVTTESLLLTAAKPMRLGDVGGLGKHGMTCEAPSKENYSAAAGGYAHQNLPMPSQGHRANLSSGFEERNGWKILGQHAFTAYAYETSRLALCPTPQQPVSETPYNKVHGVMGSQSEQHPTFPQQGLAFSASCGMGKMRHIARGWGCGGRCGGWCGGGWGGGMQLRAVKN